FILLSFFTSNVFAQTAELRYHVESFYMSSGLHNGVTNEGGETIIAFNEIIRGKEAPWLRINFEDADLGENSFIIMRSVYDGKEQKLDATSIEQWQYSSAYFNGFEIEIELHVAPLDENIFFTINELAVGEFYDGDILFFSICGPTDDRIASDQHATSRLVSIGCTAWIIPNGHFVTAGHCLDGSNSTVVEFQVPLSLPNGTIQHPGPEDQYSVDVSTKVFVNGGVGNDWGTFEVFPNSVTGLMPIVAQGAFWPLVQDLGPDSIRITGYGVDGPPPGFGNGARDSTNQTQQTNIGPNAGSSGTTMRYVTDTQGGNSGSPIIDELTGNAVGVHTHGGCNSGGGNNNGTSTFNTAFWIAVEQGAGGNTTFSDDFEAYTASVQLVSQNNIDWDTWSGGGGTAEDPFVSNLFSYSGSNSVVEIPGNDFIRRHGDKTTGKWYMSFLFYIQATNSGYFNTMNDFDGTFVWGMDCFFDVGGTGRVDTTGGGGGGTNDVPFTWSVGQWNQAMVVVDLDATPPLAEFWTGTDDPLTLVATWDWTQGGTKVHQLAVNDFFGGAATDEMYIDDYYFGDTPPAIVPVELTSFAANVNNEGDVILNWTTATETNNQGFEVQRSTDNQFTTIGFVDGFGTSTENHNYSYVDGSVQAGSYTYRLKQVDYDGTFEYSDIVEVNVTVPDVFSLEQNYPNPFNPSTMIKFSLAADSKVSLTVFDILGQEVSNLISGNLAAGLHEINFNASNINSGVYFYRIDATGVDGTNFTSVKKMILTK
ncbi:T9SS type A sorting domain-containing protein, partial [Bacteroidota bacterium]